MNRLRVVHQDIRTPRDLAFTKLSLRDRQEGVAAMVHSRVVPKKMGRARRAWFRFWETIARVVDLVRK